MAEQRTYTDEEKAEALRALQRNGGNVKKAAEITGIPRTTLQTWKQGGFPDADKGSEEFQEALSRQLKALLWQMVEWYADNYQQLMEKATNPKQPAVAVATLIDKVRLLEDKPTEIQETRKKEVEQELKKALDRVE